MAGQGEPQQPGLFTPAVGVVIGYVLLAGNPWLNRDITIALSDADSAVRIISVLFSYASWHVDVDRVGPFLFWFANLRAVLFVALTIAGLASTSRWVRETAGRTGLFVVTVGLTTLSAVTAELGSAALTVTLMDTSATYGYFAPDRSGEFFLSLFSTSASFGMLFGLVLGAVVAAERRAPANGERRADTPKSFW
ncbi:hypothetical protein ACFOWZ_27955 [Lentzea rhizosphaerae]|uniref:Uncharacterized protein n=1 Tax=Lentzea rhizosphaerae TaxID=2041025 RepID=A0ABV8C016_9PSEU